MAAATSTAAVNSNDDTSSAMVQFEDDFVLEHDDRALDEDQYKVDESVQHVSHRNIAPSVSEYTQNESAHPVGPTSYGVLQRQQQQPKQSASSGAPAGGSSGGGTDKYEGHYLKHGIGRYTFSNGDCFEGEWAFNFPVEGTLTYAAGHTYKGHMREGMRHGFGRLDYALPAQLPNAAGAAAAAAAAAAGAAAAAIRPEEAPLLVDDRAPAPPGDSKEEARNSFLRYTGEWHEDQRGGEGEMLYRNGARYGGMWQDGKPHGMGEISFANGDVYVGPMQEGKRHGPNGKMHYARDGSEYVGDWEDDQKHGHGVENFQNGASYDGEWVKGAACGEGAMTYSDGTVYAGTWKDGRPDGMGRYTYANGDSYEGGMLAGQKSGSGVMTTASGARYEGDWKNDKMQGQGIMTTSAGDHYEGFWRDNRRQGKGVLNTADGQRYSGTWSRHRLDGAQCEWVDTKSGASYTGGYRAGGKHGDGVMKYPNGDSYDGTWQNDMRHGKGTLSMVSTGDTYFGEFVDNECEGEGKMRYGSGDVYTGTWKAGLRHGTGIHNFADGSKYDGEWQEGSRHGQGLMQYSNGYQYVGTWEQDAPHGIGTWHLPGEMEYHGRWLHGAMHGQGTLKFETGDVFEGYFRDGDLFYGTMKYASSEDSESSYVGEWGISDDRKMELSAAQRDEAVSAEQSIGSIRAPRARPHGFGCMTYPMGLKYKGMWKDGHPVERRRMGLVIGNNRDSRFPVATCSTDAREVAKSLRALDFNVHRSTNLGQKQMQRTIRLFCRSLCAGDLGFFFFSGHATEAIGRSESLEQEDPRATGDAGERFLIPASSCDDLQDDAISLSDVFSRLGAASKRLNGDVQIVVVLDVCRPGWGGLEHELLDGVPQDSNMTIIFSAPPVDEDGENANKRKSNKFATVVGQAAAAVAEDAAALASSQRRLSPFSKVLAQTLGRKPRVALDAILLSMEEEVKKISKGKQSIMVQVTPSWTGIKSIARLGQPRDEQELEALKQEDASLAAAEALQQQRLLQEQQLASQATDIVNNNAFDETNDETIDASQTLLVPTDEENALPIAASVASSHVVTGAGGGSASNALAVHSPAPATFFEEDVDLKTDDD